jgi:hypothetical protein
LGAVVIVPAYLLSSSAQSIGRLRKSSGVTLTSPMPLNMGMSRQPTIPMSWKSGSHDTITSVRSSQRRWAMVSARLW